MFMKSLITALLASLLLILGGSPAPVQAASAQAWYVVDGDTIRLRSGTYVRLIGENTPEVRQCGYRAAKRALDGLVNGEVRLVNPRSVDDRDLYGRLLRYVHDSGVDTGLALIRRGLAKAAYDSRTGYDWHPRQATYIRADRNNPDRCR